MALATDANVVVPASQRLDRLRVNRFGLWLFFFSEGLIFGLLLSARFYLEGIHREELDQLLGLGITVILLLSSVSVQLALDRPVRGAEPSAARFAAARTWAALRVGASLEAVCSSSSAGRSPPGAWIW